MARKLKTFLTDLGFFQLAVAAPSMKAALAAWGLTHNIFQQGLASETSDPAIVAAAQAVPGTVLRRPVGTRGAFKEHADLPKVKSAPKAKAKPKKDVAALRKAELALSRAAASHQKAARALTDQRDRLDRRIAQEEEQWLEQRDALEAAVKKAGR